MKKRLPFIIILFFLIQYTEQNCIRSFKQQKSILKGNHKNVLQLQQGSMISSKKINMLLFGNNGSLFKDNPYTIMSNGVDFIYCHIGSNISIALMQKYLLNTLKIWLQEYDYIFQQQFRYYDIIIYTILNNEKTKIYESKQANCIITIEFPDQFVEEFQVQFQMLSKIKYYFWVYQRRTKYRQIQMCNNKINLGLHIIKAVTYNKYS
ncbi:unnamed protein product [Paramecium pentaurelia]|uniref:Transmembrane protein n=1 Tax=Paramecium pentaurelia TaxID=43138 RepID=A0A8S1YIE8_9CILI|nr:unnamed protein product [Paramecium pentaurelia]